MRAPREILGLELLGVPIHLACDDRVVAERLALCYGRSRTVGALASAALHASVDRCGVRWRIVVEGRDERYEDDPIAAVRALNHELLHGVMLRTPAFYFVHAAVVAWRGRGIVLPGLSRAGKSTLALALLLEGAEFLSDEILALDPVRGTAHAFPRAVKIRDECAGYFPEFAASFAGTGEGRFLRFDALPADLVAAEARVAAVVVPRWTGTGTSRFVRIPRGTALLALSESSLNFGTHRLRSLDWLAELVCRVDAFSLDWREPRAAARAVLWELAA
jgi:hypothetical protein